MNERLSEQWIIRRVAERFGSTLSGTLVGIGDDAAVLNASDSAHKQLITTDTLIEGVHFDLRYMTLADVGYKALAVNLSDINAMGGESVAALGTLGVPKGTCEAQLDQLLNGIELGLKLCADAGQACALIGGDTVAAPQWVIGFTVMGRVEGEPLLRSGAKPGDLVWHSGTLGLGGVGWRALRDSVGAGPVPTRCDVDHVVDSATPAGGHKGLPYSDSLLLHKRPIPPLSLGPWLQRHGIATAEQDLSDSLSQVAIQLAAASGVGIELDFRDYEFAPEVADYAQEVGSASAAKLLLAQAEDYQLLFTAPPEQAVSLREAPVPCTLLGRVVDTAKGNSYMDEQGARHELIATGFEHL